MELFLTAVVLYLWQCVVFLPLGGAAFLSVRSFAAKARRGPGFHLLSPWPGDISIVSGGLPFELGIAEVYAPSPLPRGDLSLIEDTVVSLDGSERFRVRGSNVVAGGRVFLRAASPHHAEHLAETLQRLKETASPKRSAVLRGLVDAAYDLSAFRAALASSTRVVRPLQWCCALYLMMAAGVLPVLALFSSGEIALRTMLIPLAVAHIVSLGALVLAEARSLRPASNRTERFFIAALYPPALLRTPSEWISEQLVPFHPATVAAALLDRENFIELVRREVAEVDHPRWERHGIAEVPSAPERKNFLRILRIGLLSLLEQVDKDSPGLGVRHRVDVDAVSYCPFCLGDFRSDFRYCKSCGVATVAYDISNC